MKTIAELKSTIPQVGKVSWMGVRPRKREPLHEVTKMQITTEQGIRGDHYSKQDGKRMVTLIQAEHIDVVSSIMGAKVEPDSLRRNIVVSGINLFSLQEVRFQIGDDLVLEGTGLCHPCSRMETNLGTGGYNAMRSHGGITARVIQSGEIQVGDSVKTLTMINT